MGLVEDLRIHLTAESIVGTSDWPVVERRVHEGAGDQLVILTEDGGFEPETPAPSCSIGDTAMWEPAVQVRVRGEAWDSPTAFAKAVQIRDELHGILRETVGYTLYMRIKAQTPEPLFIGFDGEGRPEFTQSFRALAPVVPV